MKPIYINRDRPKRSKLWLLALATILVVMTLALRVVAPFALEAWINQLPADKNGHALKVGDVDLRALAGEIVLVDLRLVDAAGAPNLVEASRVVLSLVPGLFFGETRTVKLVGEDVTVYLSGDLVGEARRETLEHVKTLEARLTNLTVKETDNNVIRTILSLADVRLELGEDRVFKLASEIDEGGKLTLSGSRGTIAGSLSGIRPEVFTKLTGDRNPIVINEPNLTARIDAAVSGAAVQGTLTSSVKNYHLQETPNPEPRPGAVPRKGPVPAPDLLIPFTLQETFSFDFSPAAEELRKRNL
jgi:hypothetical protein